MPARTPINPCPGPSSWASTRPSSSRGTGGSSSAADRTRWTPTATPSIRATWPRNSSWPLDNLEAVLAAADMTLANIVRLNVYTTDVDELFKHWARLTDRFGNADGGFATTVLGVTRLAAPGLLVLLEATAVD